MGRWGIRPEESDDAHDIYDLASQGTEDDDDAFNDKFEKHSREVEEFLDPTEFELSFVGAVLLALKNSRAIDQEHVSAAEKRLKHLLAHATEGWKNESSSTVERVWTSALKKLQTQPIKNPSATELLFCYCSNHPGPHIKLIGTPKRMMSAYAPGYKRVFRGWSRRWEGGVASLKAGKGRPCYGYVAEITKKQLERMDEFEGVTGGHYSRKKIKVVVDDEEVTAWAYFSSSNEFNEPSLAYLAAVVKTIGTFWQVSGPDDITVE